MSISDSILVFKFSSENNFSQLNTNKKIKNFIADLTDVNVDVIENIKDKFITFDETISKNNGSFVIVCQFVFDEKLTIVPTLQEAYDYLEMEEIERQLKL